MMKIGIITLGCRTNESEAREMAETLSKFSYETTFNIEKCDYFILNTCSITEKADAKSRQLIRRVLRTNENAKIIVCGCVSKLNFDFFEKHEKIEKVFDVKEKMKVIDYFKEIKAEEQSKAKLKLPTRRLVKIQDGCNQFCTYCIIPYLRGRSRSKSLEDAAAEILNAKEKEVVITGINIMECDFKLEELLQKIKETDKRIRIASLYPQTITHRFLTVAKSLKNFCPHFHLSMQSGSNGVLKRMGRKYTTSEFISAVELIRQFFPNAFVACDIITGFPKETEEEFNETLKTVKKCNFSFMHIFPYSPRKGTLAEKMEQVPSKIKTERAKILGEINKQNFAKFLNSQIGKTAEVLIEEHKNGFSIGHSKNYIKCYIKSCLSIGQVYKITLRAILKDGILCE